MKKLTILLAILMLSFVNLAAEWKLVDSLEMSMLYMDLDCVDNLNCFSVGNSGATQSTYLKTTDGGYNWEIIYFDEAVKQYDSEGNWVSTIPPKYKPIRCIDYITPDFAVAGHKEGQITITHDGGKTWDSTQLDTDKDIINIEFSDEKNGFAFAWTKLFKTSDGGLNWYKIDIEPIINNENFLVNFQIVDSVNYLFIVYDRQNPDHKFYKIVYTTDDGNNWIEGNKIPQYADWTPYFINIDTGWITGRIGIGGGYYKDVIYKTTNSGIDWDLQLDTIADVQLGLNGIYFKDENEGIAWGDGGKIWRTNNGGENWIQEELYPFPTGDHFRDLVFPEGHTNKILANVYVFRQIWMYEKGTSVKSYGEKNDTQFSVYPNPVQDYLRINPPQSPFGKGGSELASRGITEIAIYNVLGEKVNDLSPALSYEERGLKIDVSHLTSGIYFIKIGDKVEKFVKE